MGCHGPDDYEVYEIAPDWLAQGPDYTNYITVTNWADYWDNVKAFSALIVVHGDIIGATRLSFPIALDLNDVPLQGMAQVPIGYDPAVATPLLISVPGTGENREDAVKRVLSQEYQLAFLLNPVRVETIKAIADASDKMPRKSTYFYPKLPAGLIVNRLQ